MNLLTKENDLITFINEKKNGDESIDPNKLYYYYSKIIRLSYIKSYIKLKNIQYAKICADIIENIFWLVFQLTFNIKLTMFLSERAILLFTEYIHIGNDDIQIEEAKLFVYEKTIGPIQISDFKTKRDNSSLITKIKTISNHCENINRFYFIILCNTLHNENEYNRMSGYFENMINIFNLFPNVKIFYKVLFDIINDMKLPILVKINLLFIFSHIFYIKKKNYDELSNINKLCKDVDFREIDRPFNNQIDIEYTRIYEHYYNIL